MNFRHWLNDYLGKPYKRGAYGPNEYDCWGLVHHIYKHRYGIDLPFYHENMSTLEIAREMAKEHRCFEEVTDYQNGDLLLLCGASRPYHIGIVFLMLNDTPNCLHAVHEAGVMLTPVNVLSCLNMGIQRHLRYVHADKSLMGN